MNPDKNHLPQASRTAANGDSTQRPQVTLETLLRFKRSEQPPAEFWQQFDRELRAKQLAAIVARKPWWTPLTRYAGLVSRHSLPLGAAAALAVSLAGFYEYRSYSPARPAVSDAQNAEALLPETTKVAEADVPAAAVPEEHAKVAMNSGSQAVAGVAVYHNTTAREFVAPARLDARSLALDAGSEAVESPSARSIAANLAAAQAAEPEVIRNLLGLSRGLDARMMPAVRARTEPLEQMSSPSSERRSRLLGGVVPALATYGGDVPVPVSDRIVKDLSDDRLYQSVSRYVEGGDYLSIKVKF